MIRPDRKSPRASLQVEVSSDRLNAAADITARKLKEKITCKVIVLFCYDLTTTKLCISKNNQWIMNTLKYIVRQQNVFCVLH